MNDLAGLGFWLFLGLVFSTAVAAVLWARTRERQMRHELVLKLLETGKSLDPETLEKLLAPPTRAQVRQPSQAPLDPRAGYRTGNFIFFLVGFATLLYAFLRHAGASWPLLALGVFAMVMASAGWWVGDKQFRDGTLPTLKYKRDPRDAHLNAGFTFFMIGYGTMLIGVTREGGVSYPVVGLGLLLVGMCFNTWRLGNKEIARAGLPACRWNRNAFDRSSVRHSPVLASADEATVVALAKSGDVPAFEELVKRHQSWLRNFLRRLCGNAAFADDLAQQAFLRAWRSIASLKTDLAFGAWLRRMAVNAWLDHARRRDPLDVIDAYSEGAIEEPDPVDAQAIGEGVDLYRALSTLAAPVRLCIVLSYSEGMSHSEISEATGLPLGTVKSHITRGLERLQKTLRTEGS